MAIAEEVDEENERNKEGGASYAWRVLDQASAICRVKQYAREAFVCLGWKGNTPLFTELRTGENNGTEFGVAMS
jgi:hypothetical protein